MSNNETEKFETAFFEVPTSANERVNKLIKTLKIENQKTGFVKMLPQDWGLPKWENVVWAEHIITASRDSSGADSTADIIIPMTINNENLSALLIAKYVEQGYQFIFYTTNYLYNITHDSTYDKEDAENKLSLFFYMENYSFYEKDFKNIPSFFFPHCSTVDYYGNKKISIQDVDRFSTTTTTTCIHYMHLCEVCGLTSCPLSTYFSNCVTTLNPPDGGDTDNGGVYTPTGGTASGGGPIIPPFCPATGTVPIPFYKTAPGSGTPCTPLPPQQSYFTIEDFDFSEVGTPCIQNIITNLGEDGCNSHLLKLYQQAISSPTNKHVKIKFLENGSLTNNMGHPIPGHTDIVSLPNNVKEIIISINSSYLQNASQEFIGLVILHELTHGFLLLQPAGSTEDNQHIRMFHSQVASMSFSLLELFPTLTAGDGLSLALQGMDNAEFIPNTNPLEVDPIANAFTMQHYGIDLVTARTKALEFLNGMSGTPCQ